MNPNFMLDTDTVSLALRGEGGVAVRILNHRPSELCISSITLSELRFGADSKKSRSLHRLIDTFIGSVQVLPFDFAAANKFGIVASSLKRKGKPIGTFDTLLASHALSKEVTFVTCNLRHFKRVSGLKVESWA